MGTAGRLGRTRTATAATGRLGHAAQQGWEQQQQQAAGWGTPAQQQPQQAAWGTPAAQQGWDQQQQQAAGWGTPAQQQPQQAAWGTPAAQQGWDQQQQQAAGWGAPAQQGFGGSSGSGQNWGQPAQQSPAQNAWGGGAPAQPTGGPAWGQAAQAQQQSFGATEGADSDRTVLRAGASAAGMAMGGVAPGRLGMVRIEEGKEPGRVYEVRKEALSIGRSRESDIFLEDLAVSRLHASIISQGNGNYALRDEGSANGTKVNGQPVNKYQPYQLQDGDKIQLGQTVLVFGRR
ncbi:MAG TPA: FHA domain-containing protein [Ktedonobacteraceae bacterium]